MMDLQPARLGVRAGKLVGEREGEILRAQLCVNSFCSWSQTRENSGGNTWHILRNLQSADSGR